MLAAGLGAELLAELLRVPPMLLLLGAGALLGPSVAGAIDIPLDSMGARAHPHPRRLLHPLPRWAAALAHDPEQGCDRAAHARHTGGRAHRALDGRRGGRRLRRAAHDRPPHRRRALAHGSGHPHPAVRADAPARQGVADDHRRVGAERPDRRRPRPRLRGSRPQRERLSDHADDGLPRRPGALDRPRNRVRDRPFSRRLEPAYRHLARVGGDRGHRRRRGQLLLDRLRGRKRLSRRVPRRASSSGTCRSWDSACTAITRTRCARSSRRCRTRW